jgi:hypothetical protein
VYTIIGGDGREYGPVPTDQIRSWIASGRADLNTKAKELGSDEWKTLGDFPAFSGGVARAGEPPAPIAASTSPLVSSDVDQIVGELTARAGKLDVFGCYERSWNLLKNHFWPLLGVSLLIALITAAFGFSLVPGIFLGVTLGGVFTGGLQYYYLKKVRGETTNLGDAFAGFTIALGTLIIASILTCLFCMVGTFLLLLPGIYLSVAYQFTYLLAIDKKLDFWTAMEVSRRVITANWWRMFGLMLLAVPFFLMGLVCLGVGIFVAIVLVQGALVCAYEDLCNPKAK